ncbi:MAG TPA: RlmE family RNA methyltransferase [Alphaproteobacteria bacterium]|nr:RlmE family RNA methyltransferase [Alphaproteobacteria bacterium]
MSGSHRRPGKAKPGGRQLTVKVKTAGKRSASSTRWLARQLNDPYVAEAKRLGYRSRAAFKLAQLDDRFDLIRPGARIVDLGAAPGGWTQVAVERARSAMGQGCVVAVDLSPMEPVEGAQAVHLDFLAPETPSLIRAALGGPADLVMSDMAAPATGHSRTDHLRVMVLAEAAHAFAREVLAPGGAFVAKLLRGGADKQLLDALKRDFAAVRHVKPPASRTDSAEIYVVATGFRGG